MNVAREFDRTNPIHWGIVAAVGFAALMELFVFLIVAYDLWALRQTPPWRTVSDDIYRIGNGCPPIALLMTAMLAAPPMILVGHLFFGQTPK